MPSMKSPPDVVSREFGIPIESDDRLHRYSVWCILMKFKSHGEAAGHKVRMPISMSRSFSQAVRAGYKEYKVTGRRTELEESKLRFRVHHMDLSSDDKEGMKLNPKHLPNPTVSGDRRSDEFHLPLGLRIVYDSSPAGFLACALTGCSFQLSKTPRERKTAPRFR